MGRIHDGELPTEVYNRSDAHRISPVRALERPCAARAIATQATTRTTPMSGIAGPAEAP